MNYYRLNIYNLNTYKMIKRFIIITVSGIVMMSCGTAVNTLLKINTGEAKQLAKKVIMKSL